MLATRWGIRYVILMEVKASHLEGFIIFEIKGITIILKSTKKFVTILAFNLAYIRSFWRETRICTI